MRDELSERIHHLWAAQVKDAQRVDAIEGEIDRLKRYRVVHQFAIAGALAIGVWLLWVVLS